MPRCPLCEHVQERGEACEVCGRRLSGAGALVDPVALLEGLELHRHAPVPEAGWEVVPGLERAGTDEALPALPPEEPPELWLEPTVQRELAIAVEPLEVERTAAAPERSASLDEIPTCPHCGELVPSGETFCLRCGMRTLPVPAAPEESAARVRCRQCGAVARGERCQACGSRLPVPQEA